MRRIAFAADRKQLLQAPMQCLMGLNVFKALALQQRCFTEVRTVPQDISLDAVAEPWQRLSVSERSRCIILRQAWA